MGVFGNKRPLIEIQMVGIVVGVFGNKDYRGLSCGVFLETLLNLACSQKTPSEFNLTEFFFREVPVGTHSIRGPTACLPTYRTWHAEIHTHTLHPRKFDDQTPSE